MHSDQTSEYKSQAISVVPVHQKPSILVTGIVRLDRQEATGGQRCGDGRESSAMIWQKHGKARPAYLGKAKGIVKKDQNQA